MRDLGRLTAVKTLVLTFTKIKEELNLKQNKRKILNDIPEYPIDKNKIYILKTNGKTLYWEEDTSVKNV